MSSVDAICNLYLDLPVVSIEEQIRSDILSQINDYPSRFSFKGVEYVGTASGIRRRRNLDIGGIDDAPEITIAVNLKTKEGDALFGANRPIANDRIIYKGRTYRVAMDEVDQFEECLQLDLTSDEK